jgi:hypothetical protein
MRIEQWINQEHLDSANQRSRAGTFATELCPSIVLDNFLRPEKLTMLRRIFATEGKFEERFYLHAKVHGRLAEEAVTAEMWHTAPEAHRASMEYMYVGPHDDYRAGLGTITNIKFGELLRSPMFMSFLEAVTGIRPATLTGMMTRILVGGQYIRPHKDFRKDRDLCGVFYLSTDWHPSYGGRFRHRGTGSDNIPVEPLPNRLLLFQPRADLLHDVERITEAGADWQRWAYTLWFGTPLAASERQATATAAQPA